ncbi:MAG: AraC family transcriptional regulator [Streptomyces sp.]|nr:AraC family transcriptional regulator [Streptomyces sp.]
MLDERVFRSEDLPVGERFEAYQEVLSQAHAPMRLTSDFAADFRATQSLIGLGDAALWPASFPQLTFHRTPGLIRKSDPETCHLSLVLRGGGIASWDRTQTVLGEYDFHTNHSSVPYAITSCDGPIRMIGIEVPRTSLDLPWQKVQSVVGQAMSGRDGVGALLVQFLTRVTGDTSVYRAADAPRLGQVLAELVSALFARALDADEHLLPETRTHTLTLDVKDFIRRNLCDADLSPSSVAAARHISRSHLHRLFQAEGDTVAAYIRRQRLEAARRELADSSRTAVPIHAIAARWGFKDHATFTRSFRAAYGTTPRDYRHAAHLTAPARRRPDAPQGPARGVPRTEAQGVAARGQGAAPGPRKG